MGEDCNFNIEHPLNIGYKYNHTFQSNIAIPILVQNDSQAGLACAKIHK